MLKLLQKNIYSKIFLLLFFMFSFVFAFSSINEIRQIGTISPLAEKSNYEKNGLKEMLPLLWGKPNNFKIVKSNDFIPKASAANEFENASSYLAVDEESGRVLAQKDSKEQLPIASLTKIMTAVVVLDLAKEDDVFVVSEKAASTPPTKIGVVAGEKMTVKELLNAMLITSANDAAEVLREGVNEKYGASIFEKAMNEKARFLGLKQSNFDNPQGFDSQNNHSSSEDLAVLAHYALVNYPLISEIVKKDYEYLPANNMHKQFDLYNWNGLLGVYPGVKGVKIGNTDLAETTTVVSSERGNRKVMVIVLGAPTVIKRDLWAANLLDVGFKALNNSSFINVTEEDLLRKYSTWKYWN